MGGYVLEAEKDNSIYSENDNSNGSGIYLFAGRTNSAALRRALVKFDITSIPANATITEARLSITGSRQSSNSISAHRLNGDWGESTSNASGQEGQGASPAADDATWNFQFFSTNAWSTVGGDFEADASATTSVSSGATSNWEGANMVKDVQDWISGNADNHGWILIGVEDNNGSAIRMNSRENGSNGPSLEITYTVPLVCSVDGGRLTTATGDTSLTICAGDGVSDAFDVSLTGNVGSNSAWVITDDLGNILALPAAPPFDLEGAGAGTCLIWHLSFADGLTGAEVGNNASDLMGCFDLSNPITVERDSTGTNCVTSTRIIPNLEIDFNLWPNPATDVINLNASFGEIQESVTIEIRTILGNKIFDLSLNNQLEFSQEVNVSNLPAGMYTTIIRTQSGIASRKFIKK